jgi:hypothetical protein
MYSGFYKQLDSLFSPLNSIQGAIRLFIADPLISFHPMGISEGLHDIH